MAAVSALAVAALVMVSACARANDLTFRERTRARAASEGPILSSIRFAGNDTFDRKILLTYMTVQESGFFHTVRYTRRAVERDLANIERFYMTQGFMRAQAVIEDELPSDDSLRIAVLIGVYEGPRWTIESITFDGNTIADDQRLRQKMALAPGGPFLTNELESDRRAVLDLYARRSYLDARVVQTVDVDDEARTATIHYHVVEREQASIDAIDVTGDDKTRQYVIERELTLKSGDLFDPEKIGESQARIYRTGLFNSVWMEPAKDDTGKVRKRLLVRVRERPSGHIDFKVGYAALSGAEVSVGVTNRNVQGQAIEVSVGGTYSSFERGAEASIGDPWFVGRRVAAEATGSYSWNDEESYVAETTGAGFVLTKRFGSAVTLESGYEFERTTVLSTVEVSDGTGANYTSDVFGAVTLDTRDDILDAKRGSMSRGRVDFASSKLGGTNDFVRYEFAFRGFGDFHHGRVVALALRAGWVKPQGDGADVPVNERYFAGGDGSVRGFERNSLSPRDSEGNPKGGRALTEVRGEIRFPIWKKLRGVVFTDAGQAFDDLGAVRLSRLEVGAGAGLRFGTPIGVVRFDVAWPVTEPGPAACYFGIGQAF